MYEVLIWSQLKGNFMDPDRESRCYYDRYRREMEGDINREMDDRLRSLRSGGFSAQYIEQERRRLKEDTERVISSWFGRR